MNKLLQRKIILKNILITEKPSVAMEFSKVLKENGIGIEYPFSKEKLSPVLAYYIVENADEGNNVLSRKI